uniref:Uncharacterized protein n=1 Tax=Accipiter nisus TaxID=211598 RepID=A0A8B9RX99_9AVES
MTFLQAGKAEVMAEAQELLIESIGRVWENADHDQEWAQEHYRLGTFVEFPLSCPVSTSALAQAGFIYTGEGDKVKCFSCNTTIEGWAPGDSAVETHKKLSPNCKFITESTCLENNIHPLAQNYQHRTENGSNTLYPKNPAMCSEETRLKSFHSWPLNSQLTPKELANAGFYYTEFLYSVNYFS